MFRFDDAMLRAQPLAVSWLDGDAARLLWCQAVHVALQREFGDAGMGVEHLLRCVLVGLVRCPTRRLAIGTPGFAQLTRDEAAMLALFAAPSAAALAALAGPAAERLLPLFEALHVLTHERHCRSH